MLVLMLDLKFKSFHLTISYVGYESEIRVKA
jgi:hypothetical protein